MIHHDAIYSRDFQTPDGQGCGWIQWKGTEVCIDLHCVCGHHGHFDGEFFYFYECPQCHRKFAVGQNVKLIELTVDEVKHAEQGTGFKTSPLKLDSYE